MKLGLWRVEMKVLVPFFNGTGYFLPEVEIKPGGAELGIYTYTSVWVSMGYDLHYLCYHDSMLGMIRRRGASVWLLPRSERIWLSNYLEIYKIMKIVNPEIVYQVGADKSIYFLGIMARNLGITTILRLANDRDILPENKKVIGYFGQKLYLKGLKMSDIKISQTQQQMHQLNEELGITSVKIPNCKEVVERRQIGERNTYSWIARCTQAKRPDLFLKLARENPKLKFTMVTVIGDSKFEKYIEAETSRISNLTLIPGLSRNDVLTLLGNSKALISTSEYEGFPNTFLEASVQETPVISLRIDPDFYLSRYRAGRIFDEFKTMSSEMGRIDESDVELREMGRNGRRAVKEEYGIDRVSKMYLEVFEKVCLARQREKLLTK
jgi:glycosyltransferase involved in cell wall biosynthesis